MKPVSVSVLSDAIRQTLNQKFGRVLVEGEFSGISRPQSGHIYLTLKDEFAQINCVVWRTTAQQLKFDLEDGQKVICGGLVDIYPQRGTYQLIIQHIQPVGIGELELAFRQLHAKLQAEGLFEAAHKQPLPRYPKKVAVVTSPSGAAIRDFLQVLSRRWKNTAVTVLPVKVQGPGASQQIAAAVNSIANFADLPDVVVALTPSEAAERLVPDRRRVLQQLDNVKQRMKRSLSDRVTAASAELQQIATRSVFARPMTIVERNVERINELERRLEMAMQRKSERSASELVSLAGRLDAISPLAVLARGYSLTSKIEGKQRVLVTEADSLALGDEIQSRLSQGTVTSKVTDIADTDSL